MGILDKRRSCWVLLLPRLRLITMTLTRGKTRAPRDPPRSNPSTAEESPLLTPLLLRPTSSSLAASISSNEVTGEEAVREILKMKKPDDGETAVCVFVCAEGFMEAESERMIDWINEERAKKGKKKKGNKNKNKNKGNSNKKKDKKNKKKSKKNKKNKKKCQKEGNTCNSALNQPHMEVKASCKDGAWVFESRKGQAATKEDLVCEAVPA